MLEIRKVLSGSKSDSHNSRNYFCIIPCNTPVGVVRKRKMLIFVRSCGLCRSVLHICESVFRKSLLENVVVFNAKGWYGTALTFV